MKKSGFDFEDFGDDGGDEIIAIKTSDRDQLQRACTMMLGGKARVHTAELGDAITDPDTAYPIFKLPGSDWFILRPGLRLRCAEASRECGIDIASIVVDDAGAYRYELFREGIAVEEYFTSSGVIFAGDDDAADSEDDEDEEFPGEEFHLIDEEGDEEEEDEEEEDEVEEEEDTAFDEGGEDVEFAGGQVSFTSSIRQIPGVDADPVIFLNQAFDALDLYIPDEGYFLFVDIEDEGFLLMSPLGEPSDYEEILLCET